MSTGQSSDLATIVAPEFVIPDIDRAESPKLPVAPPVDGGPTIRYEGLDVYRFSVEQYEKMAECGILSRNDRVFLLDGLVVQKMTFRPPHVIAMDQLTILLVRATPAGWYPSNQMPLVIGPKSEPEPDLKIVRGIPNDYRRQNAGPQDVVLVIEVSDTSLHLDQTIMKARYAAAGILVYWIVNLRDDRVEVYSDPTGPDSTPDYRRREEFGRGDSVPLVLDGHEVARIAVSDILPRPLED
jgi:Uma2 family endonuclease